MPSRQQRNSQSAKSHRQSVVVVPSAAVAKIEDAEETEITAQITLPAEGGWGWVVMITSFTSICLIDAVIFCFGAILGDMRDDLNLNESLISLVNSVAYALYAMGGPIASSIINRYGFRECAMAGSIISSMALFCSYFAPNYALVILFYGVVNGFGACLCNMSSSLVVGFYFEKLRAIVMAISSAGSSIGVMVFYPINSFITETAGWRVTTLFHSGMIGIIYFMGMTYRPLMSLFVTRATEEAGRIPTVTYLPRISEETTTSRRKEDLAISKTERMFHAVSSARFPTAAAVVDQGIIASAQQGGTPSNQSPRSGQSQPGSQTPQSAAGSMASPSTRLTITAQSPGAISKRQMKSLHNIMSARFPDKANNNAPMQIAVQIEPVKKLKWWQRCCHWEENVPGARPMYRDDAFYAGKVENLNVYKKSVMNVSPESRTGLEYQLAVTRAATTADIEEKRGMFTTAFKRILVSMIDPGLLKRTSFRVMCLSNFCMCLGLLIPYVFLAERNKLEGMDADNCNMMISVIGFTNLVGRLILGTVALKVDPFKIYLFASFASGLGVMGSNFSFSTYYQYACASIFGFFIAGVITIRGLVIVKFYGLSMLTNAMGLVLLFQGMGGLISTPLNSMIKNAVGFTAAFYVAGSFLTLSGIILLPLEKLVAREDRSAENANDLSLSSSKTEREPKKGLPS